MSLRLGYTLLNGWLRVVNELNKMWKETDLVQFRALYRNLAGGCVGRHTDLTQFDSDLTFVP